LEALLPLHFSGEERKETVTHQRRGGQLFTTREGLLQYFQITKPSKSNFWEAIAEKKNSATQG